MGLKESSSSGPSTWHCKIIFDASIRTALPQSTALSSLEVVTSVFRIIYQKSQRRSRTAAISRPVPFGSANVQDVMQPDASAIPAASPVVPKDEADKFPRHQAAAAATQPDLGFPPTSFRCRQVQTSSVAVTSDRRASAPFQKVQIGPGIGPLDMLIVQPGIARSGLTRRR
jgi:hypothetical protein